MPRATVGAGGIKSESARVDAESIGRGGADRKGGGARAHLPAAGKESAAGAADGPQT